MTEELVKEQLSKAYAIAVAAYAGINNAKPDIDQGFDGQFRDTEYDPEFRRDCETGFSIDYQLKATVNAPIVRGSVVFDLEAKTIAI